MRSILQLCLLTIVPSLTLARKPQPRAVDLSFGFDNNTVYFPGGIPFRWTKQRMGESKGTWYSAFDYETSEHSGTHIDAPYHFNKDGRTVDNIPLNRLFVTGILVNVTGETGTNSSYTLPASKLMEWERLHGEIPDNSVIFINFGWAKKYYPNRELYLGPSEKELSYPGLTAEAAKWIVDTKRVVGVGVDTAAPDIPGKTDVHVQFANNDIYILENLNISEPLPSKFRVIALPTKLVGGTGAPARVIAFV